MSPARAPLPPTECNCLAVRQASRQLTQLYDEALAPSGLRTTQYSVLSVLDRSGGATIQELAEALVMDRSTLGHNLRPLEREKLIELGVHGRDRRARALRLTEAGRARLSEARRGWAKAQARFQERFGEDAARRLRALLRRVIRAAASA